MTRLRLRTPSRLHFGLLGWGPGARRQFGGLGLMVDAPGLELDAEPAERWEASGPLAARASSVLERIARLEPDLRPIRVRIHRAPQEHVGLGTGTQLGMALAELALTLSGRPDPPTGTLARLAGRGLRSGVGLHGYRLGGLIVDGGHRDGRDDDIPPLLGHYQLPLSWSVLLIIPPLGPGLHGDAERQAFRRLHRAQSPDTERLSREVLLGVLPAILEGDLEGFGASLETIQDEVGRSFAPAQGGIYCTPLSEAIVQVLRSEGLHGVGQSSWGPTLYGFSGDPPQRREEIERRIRAKIQKNDLGMFWCQGSTVGRSLQLDQ